MNSEEKFQYWEDIAQYDLDTARAMFHRDAIYMLYLCANKLLKNLAKAYMFYLPVRIRRELIIYG